MGQIGSKDVQAVPHTNVVSCNPGSGAAVDSKEDCEYVKLREKTLPDGHKMIFYAHRENAPTFDEVMDDIYKLVTEALIRKYSN
ncbi:hypothetical protein JI721_15150 [Alicyclobacillus cycloheptanicus]|uniref:Uncharacterized protein n=1 Tax=Alicyclobacillus cycloheptanicus TaxID=1457 RepID=A0ABT9XDA1_9BACL|nr:hypothetical protein [Alicyclobacillus cycloheptanicus]MDQ0188276.1 hypothetical protein [Alicyclobacillus cycloheptanicus]WDM00995.1 hypothetical protein JI721_15150 [Alicyclobacillus cycloheptanicus]